MPVYLCRVPFARQVMGEDEPKVVVLIWIWEDMSLIPYPYAVSL